MPSSTLPAGCLLNGSSITDASTCDVPRTLVEKLYQFSVRPQYSGRFLNASWTRSKTLSVPLCEPAWPAERVPRRFVRNVLLESVSTAEPMPTKPPPP